MKNFLDYASAKYYAGEPIISDEEFDKLAEYYSYESVGAPVIGDRIAHAFPMWSLQKCYDDEPLICLGGVVATTRKLDGAAVANYYCEGKHFLSLTRGDGKEGLDITDKMRTLIPQEILYSSMDEPITQITGEVVAPKTIDNARNYAAGALNLKSVEEFQTRELTFIAYGITPNIYDTWTEDMEKLASVYGFKTVFTCDPHYLDEFPQDGTVFRIDDYKRFLEAGYTSKHPRGAFALKERKGGVITKLLDVEWQVGRSGVVSPVAILEPVIIGEATVSRATLHNIKYIRELDLDYGCLVEVVRSGEIIPKVVRRIYE
jgi:NAD-dependent DNA ligase